MLKQLSDDNYARVNVLFVCANVIMEDEVKGCIVPKEDESNQMRDG